MPAGPRPLSLPEAVDAAQSTVVPPEPAGGRRVAGATEAPAGVVPVPAGASDGAAGPEGEADDGRFKVRLANFEGPFDLLLQLIAKHKLDVGGGAGGGGARRRRAGAGGSLGRGGRSRG
ncbi:hypothetical protein [Streptomyces griseorubens]|uniref:hypothetical protein n=1 Tax=Streptomyces griseorubens TaxID=66897 RepID=UPI001FE1B688|nr:hypothetical protein [Streptomyces griseorubens]